MEAFTSAEPRQVYNVTQELLTFARQAVDSAAQARFHANFGTERCTHCDGLKAGIGVVATCAQRQSCYFTNFRGSDVTVAQRLIIDALVSKGS